MNDPNATPWKIAQVAELIAQGRAVVKGPVSSLPQQHRDVFEQALRNVLSTETAQMTYAQIIDGFPTTSVVRDRRGSGMNIDHDHPVFKTKHDTPCPAAWERLKEFHSSFDMDVLSMDTRVWRTYPRVT
jgi:hypothetical protein